MKKATLLEKLLQEYGIAEVVSCKQGLEFSRLVRLFKNAPSIVIRYAVRKLYEAIIMKETSADISSNFIRKLLTDKIHAKRVATARESGLYPFIVAGHSAKDATEREKAFFTKLHSYPDEQIELLLQQLLSEVIAKYSKPLYQRDSVYTYESQLDEMSGAIQYIRYLAGKQKIQPYAYEQLEHKALYRYKRSIQPLVIKQLDSSREMASLVDWMNDALNRLPRVELVPMVPPGFILEYLLP